jgi:hypothetical protein
VGQYLAGLLDERGGLNSCGVRWTSLPRTVTRRASGRRPARRRVDRRHRRPGGVTSATRIRATVRRCRTACSGSRRRRHRGRPLCLAPAGGRKHDHHRRPAAQLDSTSRPSRSGRPRSRSTTARGRDELERRPRSPPRRHESRGRQRGRRKRRIGGSSSTMRTSAQAPEPWTFRPWLDVRFLRFDRRRPVSIGRKRNATPLLVLSPRSCRWASTMPRQIVAEPDARPRSRADESVERLRSPPAAILTAVRD